MLFSKLAKLISICLMIGIAISFDYAYAFQEVEVAKGYLQHFDKKHLNYFDKFVLKDEGSPVQGLHYKISVEDGQVIEGVTNKKGETVTIYSNLKNAKVDIYQTELIRNYSSKSAFPSLYQCFQDVKVRMMAFCLSASMFCLLGWFLISFQSQKKEDSAIIKARGSYCLLYILINTFCVTILLALVDILQLQRYPIVDAWHNDINSLLTLYLFMFLGAFLSLAQNNQNIFKNSYWKIFLLVICPVFVLIQIYDEFYPVYGWDAIGFQGLLVLLSNFIVPFVMFYTLSLTCIAYYNYIQILKIKKSSLFISTIVFLFLTVIEVLISCFKFVIT